MDELWRLWCCDLLQYLFIHAVAGTQLLKPLGALRVKKYLSIIVTSPFQLNLSFSECICLSEKPNTWLKGWRFQPHPPPSTLHVQSGEGLETVQLPNGQCFKHSCLSWCYALWSLNKKPVGWGSQSFPADEHVQVLGGWLSWRGLEAPSFPLPCSASLPSGCSWVESSYNKLVI